jgi:hypothetical protein
MNYLVFLMNHQLAELAGFAVYYGHWDLFYAIQDELAERVWMNDYDHYQGD